MKIQKPVRQKRRLYRKRQKRGKEGQRDLGQITLEISVCTVREETLYLGLRGRDVNRIGREYFPL